MRKLRIRVRGPVQKCCRKSKWWLSPWELQWTWKKWPDPRYTPFSFVTTALLNRLALVAFKWYYPSDNSFGGLCFVFVLQYNDFHTQKQVLYKGNTMKDSWAWTIVGIARGLGGGRVEEGKGGINRDGRILDLGPWTYNGRYSWCVIELYTWNIYIFIDQCHPNKVSIKKKK